MRYFTDVMRRELGSVAMAVQRAVMKVLDPFGILNPAR
jgi:hypothetical protein